MSYYDELMFRLSKLPKDNLLAADIKKRCQDLLESGGSENDSYIKRFLYNLDNFKEMYSTFPRKRKLAIKKRPRNRHSVRRTTKNTKSSIPENA